jgi:hypothetical protein
MLGREGDQRIADGHLHRFRGAAIERHAVDDSLDDNSSAHELADRVHHVGVVVNPAHAQRVAVAQHVMQRLPSGRSASLVLAPLIPLIGDHLVDFEPGLLGLGALVGGGLFGGGYAGVKHDHNAEL